MNHSSHNSDDDLIAARVTSLRDSLPNASVESRLQLRMQHNWESLNSKDRKSARSPNNYKFWLIVSSAAALLFSSAIILFQHEKQVADGSQKNKLEWMGTTIEFNPLISKETNPCNILPPFADWRS